MKNCLTRLLIALLAVAAVGGSFALGQSLPAPATPAPAMGSGRTTVPATTARGIAPLARGGPGELRQPRMRDALLQLDSARIALRSALPDKGGNREKALKSVEQAINDVQAGIDYARDHPEEFPATSGARGAPTRAGASAPAGTS